jgi:ABC-2 type transport system ATP-binding protein
MSTALRVTGAGKRFGTTQALDGADFTLERGQLLLLLGPNGAGKTTLVRAVAGRVRLDRGKIELLGQDLNTAATARQKLGAMGQGVR